MSDSRQAAAMDEFIRHAIEPIGEAPEDRLQDQARRENSEDLAADAAQERPLERTQSEEEGL